MLKLGNNRCIGKSLEREWPTTLELNIRTSLTSRTIVCEILYPIFVYGIALAMR
jgi:hypothetical protein